MEESFDSANGIADKSSSRQTNPEHNIDSATNQPITGQFHERTHRDVLPLVDTPTLAARNTLVPVKHVTVETLAALHTVSCSATSRLEESGTRGAGIYTLTGGATVWAVES